MSKPVSEASEDFIFIETPAAPTPASPAEDYGVRTTSVSRHRLESFRCPEKLRVDEMSCLLISNKWLTGLSQYPAIKNAPLPADAAGSESFNNVLLFSLLALIPAYCTRKIEGGLLTWMFLTVLTSLPILAAFWAIASRISPRKNEKVRYPGKPVESYLQFKSEVDRLKYYGKNKISMETFQEMYFDGTVDFKGDALEVMEYRHDWANFRFTISLFRFFLTGMMPEVIMHTRSQGNEVPSAPTTPKLKG